MLKNDFLGFLKVKWLHLIGEVDKSVRFSWQFFQDLTCQKSLKWLLLDRVIQKIKRWTFGGGTRGRSGYGLHTEHKLPNACQIEPNTLVPSIPVQC